MKAIALSLIGLGVVAGAFGAHALKDILTPERLDVFKTAVFYQISMSTVLLVLANEKAIPKKILISLICGIIVFSGSLYLLVLLSLPVLGAFTPIGGTLIILTLFISSWRLRKRHE